MVRGNNAPVGRWHRQREALADFGLYAFRSTDLDAILHRATELVAEALDVKRAKVLELLPGGRELVVRAGVNWNPGVVGQVRFGADRDSPGGYALSHDEPVVSPDLESETRFQIPQVLVDHKISSMVNVLIAGDDGPYGVLEVDSEKRREFDRDDIAFLRNYANLLAAAVGRHRVHRALEQTASERQVLVDELAHRARNMLGLVQSLAMQTSAEDVRVYKETFLGRLHALARAENLLFESRATEIELARLVEKSVEPFEDGEPGRIMIHGDALRLAAKCGRMLALVLHELGTNAIKHGALSVPGGKVEISWAVGQTSERRELHLRWKEAGGAPVEPSKREGFGTKLLSTLAPAELNGRAILQHADSGMIYELVFPL